MGHGASVGWIRGVALAGVISTVACGGNSENMGRDDGSSDDGLGGSSGSASSGGTNGGGSAPTGGVSQGGTIAVGGAGTGGASSCSECPAISYGLVIEGDGPTVTMEYNGLIDTGADRAPLTCAESPLRGFVAGCGYGITLSACEGPMNGPPCLEIGRTGVVYLSRTGELFSGSVTTIGPTPSTPGTETGTFTAELTNATGETLTLTVTYSFCAPFANLRIVC